MSTSGVADIGVENQRDNGTVGLDISIGTAGAEPAGVGRASVRAAGVGVEAAMSSGPFSKYFEFKARQACFSFSRIPLGKKVSFM
jgi:hypothetical protein